VPFVLALGKRATGAIAARDERLRGLQAHLAPEVLRLEGVQARGALSRRERRRLEAIRAAFAKMELAVEAGGARRAR
jgi:hypothetical protein